MLSVLALAGVAVYYYAAMAMAFIVLMGLAGILMMLWFVAEALNDAFDAFVSWLRE